MNDTHVRAMRPRLEDVMGSYLTPMSRFLGVRVLLVLSAVFSSTAAFALNLS